MFGVEMLAVPATSVTGLVTSWPSLANVIVPVGSGVPGETEAVNVYEPPGATVADERLSVVLLATWVEPVTVIVTGADADAA
jgi:hypothetical protein